MRWTKQHTVFASLGVFLVLWSLIFFYIDIQDFVSKIGVANGYMIAIVVALVGGLSAFTTASFYTTIGVLVVGGLNPLLLALVVVPFLILGDYVFYYFGKQGRYLLNKKTRKILVHVEKVTNKKSSLIPSFFIYLYSGLTPLPADVLMGLLALAGYPFKKIAPVIFLGHITFIQVISILALTTHTFFGI